MADEPITECEQCGMGILNPDVHDQCHQGEAEPTDPSSSPATTSSPPSWWQQCAGAHDLQQAHKQGQLNLVGPHGRPTGGDWAATAEPTKEETSSVNETCAQCQICPWPATAQVATVDLLRGAEG
jgi:hypothetical protein